MNLPLNSDLNLLGMIRGLCLAGALLAGHAASAQVPTILPNRGTGEAATPAAAGQTVSANEVDDLRTKLAAVQAELSKLDAPGGLASGAPAGTPDQELNERRLLMQLLAFAYRQHINALDVQDAQEKRREANAARIRDWKGFAEEPPYSVLLLDRLRHELQNAALAEKSEDARLHLVEARLEATRLQLETAQQQARRAQEQFEGARAGPIAAVAVWKRDLAELKARVAATTLASLQAVQEAGKRERAATRLELDFFRQQIKEAERDVRFSAEDLDTLKSRIHERRKLLLKELESATTGRDRILEKVAENDRRLSAAREGLAKQTAELESARKEIAAAAKKAGQSPEQDQGLLQKLNPFEGRAQKRAEAEQKRLENRVAELERELASGRSAVAALERESAILAVRSRNAAIDVDIIGNLLVGLEIRSSFWELRFSASGGAANSVDQRKMYEGSRELLARLDPLAEYLRTQLELALSRIAEEQNILRDAANPAEAEQSRAMLEALADRERAYLRAMTESEDLRQLLRRWVEEFEVRAKERTAGAAARDWLARMLYFGKSAWQFELFAVEDTIEVDGRKITGSRGITVGKVMTAILILVLGYALAALVTRLLVRIAVRRWNVDATQARISRKWILAITAVILALISLEVVKIPFTVFAFLGGAIAIGAGFGMQTLLKNLISGMMLLIERPFRPGDIVEVGDIRGEVTDINVRSCTIRNINGIETLVPNSTFVEQNVTNWTLTTRRVRYHIKIGVAYGSPVRQVADLLREVAERHGLVLKDPPPEILFEEFGDDALIFGLYVWLDLGPKVVSRVVLSDLRFMIEKTFSEHGIVIAFPQRDVHLDASRPLQVQVLAGPGPTRDNP
jgi:small-conductance mechanosensitive channel